LITKIPIIGIFPNLIYEREAILAITANELHCRRPGFLMLCPPVADVIY